MNYDGFEWMETTGPVSRVVYRAVQPFWPDRKSPAIQQYRDAKDERDWAKAIAALKAGSDVNFDAPGDWWADLLAVTRPFGEVVFVGRTTSRVTGQIGNENVELEDVWIEVIDGYLKGKPMDRTAAGWGHFDFLNDEIDGEWLIDPRVPVQFILGDEGVPGDPNHYMQLTAYVKLQGSQGTYPLGFIQYQTKQDENVYADWDDDDPRWDDIKGDLNGYYSEVVSLSVHPKLRRQGLGTLIWEEFKKRHLNDPARYDPGTFTADGAGFFNAVEDADVTPESRMDDKWSSAPDRTLSQLSDDGFVTDEWSRWQQGQCGTYATVLIQLRPDLRLGGVDFFYDGYHHNPGHFVAHDDHYAYDSAGRHPLPYEGVHGDGHWLPDVGTPDDFGLLEDESATPEDIQDAKDHIARNNILADRNARQAGYMDDIVHRTEEHDGIEYIVKTIDGQKTVYESRVPGTLDRSKNIKAYAYVEVEAGPNAAGNTWTYKSLIGHISILWTDEYGYFVNSVGVEPEYQRRGIASKLLQLVREELGEEIKHAPEDQRSDDGKAWSDKVGYADGYRDGFRDASS